MSWLKVEEISKKIKENFVVESINFTQNKNENSAIAGATGSGKTTLLKIIAGLIQPTQGSVFLDNERIKGADEQLLSGNKNIAYLSQHFELRNNYYVQDLLDVYNKIEQKKADKIYEICKIDFLLQRKTNELSGGEKQRIALACQLVTCPKLLLLDEPFSNLDVWHKNIIKQVLENIQQELELTYIITSHDWVDILPWANNILIMNEGKIIQQGTPEIIYTNPINEYVAALSGDYNIVDNATIKNIHHLFAEPKKHKKILLRPEQINIEPAGNIFQKDVVKKINFFGSYYVIDVLVNEKTIKVKTLINNFSVGQRVVLSVNTKSLWHIA